MEIKLKRYVDLLCILEYNVLNKCSPVKRGDSTLFKVLIVEGNSVIAKGLKALVSEISNDIEAEYHIAAEPAHQEASESRFDLFVISISSDKNDIGVRFAKKIRKTKEYKVTFIILLADTKDDDVNRIILDELYYFKILKKSMDEAMEEGLKEAVLTLSEYKISMNNEEFITMITQGREKKLRFSEILWIDMADKVVTLNLVDGTMHNYLHREYSLKDLMVMLGDGFMRIFRSIIVNKLYVSEINYVEQYLMLEGVERSFKIGDSYMPQVRNYFGDK